LTTIAKEKLINLRDYASKPYLRERASALIQISKGASAHWAAHHGLLKERDPDSVYSWLNRYETEGIDGLVIREGRGRKPAYEP